MIVISYVTAIIAVLIVWVGIRVYWNYKQDKTNVNYELRLLALLASILLIMRVSFFPGPIASMSIEPIIINFKHLLPMEVSLIPFASMSAGMFFGQLFAFLPLGLSLPFCYGKEKFTFKKILITGAAVSFGIELIQLLCAGRVTDINEFISSIFGVAAGAGLYHLICYLFRIYKKYAKKRREQRIKELKAQRAALANNTSAPVNASSTASKTNTSKGFDFGNIGNIIKSINPVKKTEKTVPETKAVKPVTESENKPEPAPQADNLFVLIDDEQSAKAEKAVEKPTEPESFDDIAKTIMAVKAERTKKPVKQAGTNKPQKPVKTGITEKSVKPAKQSITEKSDKPANFDKSAKQGITEKSNKPAAFDKAPKQGITEKSNKPANLEKSAKQGMTEKSNKPANLEKSAKQGMTEKSDKPANFDKSAKQGMTEKSNKPAAFDKAPKQGMTEKSNKPINSEKSAKQNYTKKTDKPDNAETVNTDTFSIDINTIKKIIKEKSDMPVSNEKTVITDTNVKKVKAFKKEKNVEPVIEKNAITEEKTAQPVIEKKAKTEVKAAQPAIEKKAKTEEKAAQPAIVKKAKTEEKAAEPAIEKKAKTEEKAAEPVVDKKAKTEEKTAEPVKKGKPEEVIKSEQNDDAISEIEVEQKEGFFGKLFKKIFSIPDDDDDEYYDDNENPEDDS